MTMSKIELNTPTKASTVMIFDLIKTNACLTKIVKQQQNEIDMLNFRIGGFLDYLKKHCKEKKSKRMTPTKSFKAIRKDLH